MNGAPAISARAGTLPGCAERVSTPETASEWPSTSAAAPYGHWSGCHAVGWDLNAPEFGDLAVGDGFQKHSYPFRRHAQCQGRRDSSTRAPIFATTPMRSTAQRSLRQPGQFAWQVFDRKVNHLLRDEYRIRQVTRVRADTLEELVKRLEGVDATRALETIGSFNDAVRERHRLRSHCQGRTLDRRPRRSQIELGHHHRRTAVRSLCGDLRGDLHVRRVAHQHVCQRARHRPQAHRRAPCGGRTGRRPVLLQLPRRHGTDVGRRLRTAGRHLGGRLRQSFVKRSFLRLWMASGSTST